MKQIELLNPKVQECIRKRGFTRLSDAQSQAIPLIVEGKHLVLIAPTGTGKTESAMFPVFDGLLSLRDEVGCALQTPAYLRAGIDTKGPDRAALPRKSTPSRVLFVPSFNEIAGYDILQIIKKPFSPLSRLMNKEDTEIILADGTYIGPLRALIPDEAD